MNTVKFSKRGEYHKINKAKTEDVIRCRENERFSIIALSDGATSCKSSKAGATIVCNELIRFLLKNAEAFFEFSKIKTAYLIIEQILYKLQLAALKANGELSDYSATLSFCCLDKKTDKLLLFNLGDGAVFELNGKESVRIKPLLGPERIEKIYTPLITTKAAYKTAKVKIVDAKKNHSILLCSDGVLKVFNKNIDDNASLDFGGNYESLKEQIRTSDNFDDCSFVLLEI